MPNEKDFDEVDVIRVDRLLECVNPVKSLEYVHELPEGSLEEVVTSGDFKGMPSQRTFSIRRRDKVSWHIGRIRYLVECLNKGKKLEPIDIDNDVTVDRHLGGPVIVDGMHRLIAHKMSGKRTIQVRYCGRVDVLNYLKGKRKDF